MPVSAWNFLMNTSRNGAIALSWKDPIVIEPPLFALVAAALLLVLFDDPQAASSGLRPSTPPTPTAPLAITSRRLSPRSPFRSCSAIGDPSLSRVTRLPQWLPLGWRERPQAPRLFRCRTDEDV